MRKESMKDSACTVDSGVEHSLIGLNPRAVFGVETLGAAEIGVEVLFCKKTSKLNTQMKDKK